MPPSGGAGPLHREPRWEGDEGGGSLRPAGSLTCGGCDRRGGARAPLGGRWSGSRRRRAEAGSSDGGRGRGLCRPPQQARSAWQGPVVAMSALALEELSALTAIYCQPDECAVLAVSGDCHGRRWGCCAGCPHGPTRSGADPARGAGSPRPARVPWGEAGSGRTAALVSAASGPLPADMPLCPRPSSR